jgi:hypothetical protein
LSLEPIYRCGWGSVYDALASGRIQVERLHDLLVATCPMPTRWCSRLM